MNIVIDWATIDCEADFYRQVLEQLKAPAWHGHNLDALSDSMCAGGINGVEPPYSVSVVGVSEVRPGLREFYGRVEGMLRDAASERNDIEICSGVAQQAVQRDGPASGGSTR